LKVKLTFYGGINEVGGNKVLLEDFEYDVKLFIDFGLNMKKFHNEYNYREAPQSISDLCRLNFLPKENLIPIKNLYTKHYFFNLPENQYYNFVSQCKNKQDPETNLDGVLISHAHRDHFYCIPFLNRNIKIYTGVVTHKIIKAFYDSTEKRSDNFYYGLKFEKFRTGDILHIKDMEIIPVHVDHSIPAAYGFIFKTSAGIIVYSGDFRIHGPLLYMTIDLIKKAKEALKEEKAERIKALICEGTHIHRGAIESEAAVKRQLKSLLKHNPFDVIILKYDRIDWDRFRTFSSMAKKFGWKYIIPEKDAYFYYRLNQKAIYDTMRDPNILNDDHILILERGPANYEWKRNIRQLFYKNKKEFRLIKYSQLKTLEGKFFINVSIIQRDIIQRDIKKFPFINLNCAFISSSMDPYAEEYFDNTNTLMSKFNELGIPSYKIHASGHAKPHDIINFVKELNPEYLIPIHTENTEFFIHIFKNMDINVISPIDCPSIDF